MSGPAALLELISVHVPKYAPARRSAWRWSGLMAPGVQAALAALLADEIAFHEAWCAEGPARDGQAGARAAYQ